MSSGATHLGTHLARAIRGAKNARISSDDLGDSLGTQKRNAIRGDDGTEKRNAIRATIRATIGGTQKTQRNSGDNSGDVWGTQKRNSGGESEMHENPGGDEF